MGDIHELRQPDHNDKAQWVQSIAVEEEFVRLHGRALDVVINPEKYLAIGGCYAADLYNYRHHTLADLKVQRTPFLSDNERIPHQFCVTLNVMDVIAYGTQYGPRFIIYFWLQHPSNDANGVYAISMKSLGADLQKNRRHMHAYRGRDGSDGNKTHSFLLDVRSMEKVV